MEFLFITPEELTSTTILGGNVDPDKYKFEISNAQNIIIEPLLGTELYNKIYTEAESETLTGDYLTLYNNYVKPITKNVALAGYVQISAFMITNGGAFKHSHNNAELMSDSDIETLSQKYRVLADAYVLKFLDWIGENQLPEYKDANTTITNKGGWYF